MKSESTRTKATSQSASKSGEVEELNRYELWHDNDGTAEQDWAEARTVREAERKIKHEMGIAAFQIIPSYSDMLTLQNKLGRTSMPEGLHEVIERWFKKNLPWWEPEEC